MADHSVILRADRAEEADVITHHFYFEGREKVLRSLGFQLHRNSVSHIRQILLQPEHMASTLVQ